VNSSVPLEAMLQEVGKSRLVFVCAMWITVFDVLDLGLSSMSKTVLALWSVNSGFDLAEWQS
jgi:hypothetical protein